MSFLFYIYDIETFSLLNNNWLTVFYFSTPSQWTKKIQPLPYLDSSIINWKHSNFSITIRLKFTTRGNVYNPQKMLWKRDYTIHSKFDKTVTKIVGAEYFYSPCKWQKKAKFSFKLMYTTTNDFKKKENKSEDWKKEQKKSRHNNITTSALVRLLIFRIHHEDWLNCLYISSILT